MSVEPVNIENRTSATFRTVKDGIKPWPISVGGEAFVFNKRPSARLQLRVMDMMAAGNRPEDMLTRENLDTVLAVLGSMLENGESDLNRLLDATDLEEITDIMGQAMEQMSVRPTTESSALPDNVSMMTSATGASAQGSTTETSTDDT